MIINLDKIPKGIISTITYVFASLFTKGLSIITLPIFTRLMPPNEIGTINLYNTWFSLLFSISTLSLTSGGYMLAMKEFKETRSQYQSSILLLTTVSAIVLFIVFLLKPNFWIEYIGLSQNLILLLLTAVLVSPATEIWLARQRYEYKYKVASFLTTTSSVCATCFSILVVVYCSNNHIQCVAEGRIYANGIVVYGIAASIFIYLIVKGKTFYNKKYWLFSLKLSIPLLGYSVANQILSVSDRIMINKYAGLSDVGIYGTIYSISMICIVIWQAINSSFVPYLYENIEKDNNNIKEYSFKILLLFAMLAVVATCLAPEILMLLTTKTYVKAVNFIPPVAASVFFIALTNMYSNIAVYLKKTTYVMFPAVLAALMNIILNTMFIPLYGSVAAAYTTLFAYVMLALMQAVFSVFLLKKYGISNVYNNFSLLILSCGVIMACLLCIPLYDFLVLRIVYTLLVLVMIYHVFIKFENFKKVLKD